MLKFEFIQPGEFGNPYYGIVNKNKLTGGSLYFHIKSKQWSFSWEIHRGLTAESLREIADKLDELNESTRAQRILGVF